MTHITVPASIQSQFDASEEPLIVCDEEGTPLGTFIPAAKSTGHQRTLMTLPEHLRDSKVSVDELRRRLREERLIPHEEVMEMVKKLL
jgi:hypothetical protein